MNRLFEGINAALDVPLSIVDPTDNKFAIGAIFDADRRKQFQLHRKAIEKRSEFEAQRAIFAADELFQNAVATDTQRIFRSDPEAEVSDVIGRVMAFNPEADPAMVAESVNALFLEQQKLEAARGAFQGDPALQGTAMTNPDIARLFSAEDIIAGAKASTASALAVETERRKAEAAKRAKREAAEELARDEDVVIRNLRLGLPPGSPEAAALDKAAAMPPGAHRTALIEGAREGMFDQTALEKDIRSYREALLRGDNLTAEATKAKVLKEQKASSGGITTIHNPQTGEVITTTGDVGDYMDKITRRQMVQQRMAVDRSMQLIGQIRKMADEEPNLAGATARMRQALQNLGMQAMEFARVDTSMSVNAPLGEGETAFAESELGRSFFSGQLEQFESVKIGLAYALARALDPSGRLSDADVEFQLRRIQGESTAATLKKLESVEKDLMFQREQAERVLGAFPAKGPSMLEQAFREESGGEPRPLEDEPASPEEIQAAVAPYLGEDGGLDPEKIKGLPPGARAALFRTLAEWEILNAGQ